LLLAGQVSPPVRLHELLTAIQGNPLALATDAGAITAFIAYFALVFRLRLEDGEWSNWRATSFVAGLAAIFIATGSGLASYEGQNFVAHVVQHLLLMTFAPILLALGAPVSLALQASREPAQQRLSSLLEGGALGVISFPVFAAVLAYLTTAVYFLTPVYVMSQRHALLHGFVQLLFLIAGCIYWWPVVGFDPTRWKMSYPIRLAYLASGIPINSMIGIDLTLNRASIDPSNYSISDTHNGGAVLWGVSVLVVLAGIAVMYAKWARWDASEAARIDGRIERELANDPGRGLAGGIVMDSRTGLWHYPADQAPSASGPPG
jgi:putative membrane protein